MNRKVSLGFYIALCILIGTLASYLARQAWSSVVQYTPPYDFGESRSMPTAPWSEPVILIIVDGLRLDASYQMPTLNRLRAQGADFECRVEVPSFSLPARANFVTGAGPDIHGVTSNFFSKAVAADNLLRAAAKHHRSVAIAGIPEWPSLFGKDLAAAGARFLPSPPKADAGHYRDSIPPLQAFADQGLALLTAQKPNLMIIDFPATDRAAHEFGATSDHYRAAVQWIDQKIAALVDRVDMARGTIIVSSDHGHLDWGGHGGPEEVVLRTPLILAGNGIRAGVKGYARQIDVAATMAILLGLPIPAANAGSPLFNALEMDESVKIRYLQQFVQQRQDFARHFLAGLQSAVPAPLAAGLAPESNSMRLQSAARRIDQFIEDSKAAQVQSERRARLPYFLAGVSALWIALLLCLWTARSGWAELRIIGAGVAVYFIIFSALFWIGGLSFSVSAMNKESDLGKFIGKDMLFGAVAILLALVVAEWQARRTLQPQTWWSLVPVGLMVSGWVILILSIHIGVTYWRHNLFMRWHLPDIRQQFGSLLSLLQIQSISYVSVAVPLLAAGFFRWGRAGDPARVAANKQGISIA